MVTLDLSALTGTQRDAAAALNSIFSSYGLGTLAPKILNFVQQGMSADTIALELQNTPEYKARFAANDVRIKNGLPVLSPAQYLSTEESYRQIMQSADIPVGFYDQQSDFQKFLELDISPTELQGRVTAASEAIKAAPPATLDFARQWYGIGDLTAFALDPTKATALVEQRLRAAEAGALARQSGTTVSQGLAEDLGAQGLTLGQLQQGFGEVGQAAPTAQKLSQIYGTEVTADDLVKSTFLNDTKAALKLKTLASQERAAFGGSGGASGKSLANEAGGSF